jgi:hypothetical protein
LTLFSDGGNEDVHGLGVVFFCACACSCVGSDGQLTIGLANPRLCTCAAMSCAAD